MTVKIGGIQVDTFTWNYITALFWTSDETDFPEYCYSGEFSINEQDVARLSPDTLFRVIDDCTKFEELAQVMFDATPADCATHGADFCLSRNGHGAGFWDRGYGAVGDALHAIAKSFGEFNLYMGDDGIIYGH